MKFLCALCLVPALNFGCEKCVEEIKTMKEAYEEELYWMKCSNLSTSPMSNLHSYYRGRIDSFVDCIYIILENHNDLIKPLEAQKKL